MASNKLGHLGSKVTELQQSCADESVVGVDDVCQALKGAAISSHKEVNTKA
jgi:hypothetical protein